MIKGKMFLNLSARILDKYDFYSGNQIGTEAGEGSRGRVISAINPSTSAPVISLRNYDHGALGGFTTIDIDAGYKLNKMLSLGAGVSNLFNTTQREFVGSPSIGRLFSVELKAFIPNTSKK